jgi:hydroxyacylglutathione hydrolase
VKFKLISATGLAQNSYFVADQREAVVIDPRRDATIYTDLAKEACAKITYILETHRNEDYVIGSLELQHMTGAEIGHSHRTPFKYGEHNLKDNEELTVGRYTIKALHTPGHTDDSISYSVTESGSNNAPFMVFTGDTLFVGDVGRTDLPGLDIWREMTEKQYHSLHDVLLPLGDDVIIYPGHGAGTVCAHHVSDRNVSTIGYERKTNPVLQLDKEAFIEHILSIKLRRPPYFRKMEEYNLNGPPLLQDAPIPQALTVSQFKKAMENPNTLVVDSRNPDAFAASHLTGSLSIWLKGLSFYPGWVLSYDQEILLILEKPTDIDTAKSFLWRLGYDNIIGYLCPGLEAWRNKGYPTNQIGAITATQLKTKLEKNEIMLIDVRSTAECESGFVENSIYIYVGELLNNLDKIPENRPLAIACASGRRGSLAASILRRNGFTDISNVLGGLDAWYNLGYPMVAECPA